MFPNQSHDNREAWMIELLASLSPNLCMYRVGGFHAYPRSISTH